MHRHMLHQWQNVTAVRRTFDRKLRKVKSTTRINLLSHALFKWINHTRHVANISKFMTHDRHSSLYEAFEDWIKESKWSSHARKKLASEHGRRRMALTVMSFDLWKDEVLALHRHHGLLLVVNRIHNRRYVIAYTYIHTCVHTNMHTCTRICINICIHTFIYTYVYVYMCTYTYMYLYTYVYTYIYTYTHNVYINIRIRIHI